MMVMKKLRIMGIMVEKKKKRRRRRIMESQVHVDLILLNLHLNQRDRFQVRISLTKKSSILHHLIVQDHRIRSTNIKGK